MEEVVVFEWTFTPPDYFESPLHISRSTYEIKIDDGKVEARVPPDIYKENTGMRDQLHQIVDLRFLSVQVLTHRAYQLSNALMHRLHADGRKDITVFVDSALCTSRVGSPDIVVRDREGNILSDTRTDRINKKRRFSELTETYGGGDRCARALLESYAAAVRDPANELVHLYEIRDALAREFGKEATARQALSVSRNNWSRLGKLANDEPIEQGRHRGRNPGDLRPATEQELQEARSIAQELIERFLEFLESRGPGSA